MSIAWTQDELRAFVGDRQVTFTDVNRRPTAGPAWARDMRVSPVWTGNLAHVFNADRAGVIRAYKDALYHPGTIREATARVRSGDQWIAVHLRYLNLLHHPHARAMVCTVDIEAVAPPAAHRSEPTHAEVPWASLRCDGGASIIAVEGMVHHLYGCAAEDLIGRSVLDLVHPDDVGRCVEAGLRRLSQPDRDQTLTHRIKRADGGVRLIEATLCRGNAADGSWGIFHRDADRMLYNELVEALREDQFVVVYQPVIDLASGLVIGAEALIRWLHPTRGTILPAEFIPCAESSGLIADLGDWVLRTACLEAAKWPHQLHVAVNLSVRQLTDDGIVATVADALNAAGLDPHRLILEITESALINEPELAIRLLSDLKAVGVRLAIDDFGTGYSSLTYLKRMPVDTLKIDRSFVEGLGKDDGDQAIVTSVISLARAFGLAAVAEGVETDDQRDFLIGLGCDLAQGYLWSRPVSRDDFHDIVD